MRAFAAILAAGASRRLGQPRQLVRLRGQPLVCAIARALGASSCDAVAVVLGAHGDAIARVVAATGAARLANPDWREGIASSIRCAAAWAERAGADALVLATCDQVRLDARHVDRMLALHRAERVAVASRYAGTCGVPAVFGAADFAALDALAGDRGARGLLAGCAAIDWPDGAFDLDTPAELAALSVRR
ncbi:MAG TPA: NTP transferase domain-containing protein [Kofleriaceae bacterium]|nr:NTP transferase domain-containing protein [Kofleriaceae bacterium]